MKLAGSYTVEASWIMVITLSLLGLIVIWAYGLFYDTLRVVEESQSMLDAVSLFRKGEVIANIMEGLR